MENLEFTIDKDNVEQQKALDFIENTNTSLFITGKAGTGKTTFVKGIQELIKKNFLVLAPTGIAAMNVGGQTIHSFFGFPLTAIESTAEMEVSRTKILTLKAVDTIIIDEASMVRCDLVDGMDMFLQRVFHSHLPFGGKQVVFVGDMFQLPPVVKWGSDDETVLQMMYGSGPYYFYKSRVMKRVNLPKIEFQKVYRQTDEQFLGILDRMRLGDNTDEDFSCINQHVSLDGTVGDFSVTVTARTAVAESINTLRLSEIDAEEFQYRGELSGKFKPQDAPVPLELSLKVGAQVIFCRNDYIKGFMNGTIGIVKELNSSLIKVSLESGKTIIVEKMVWEAFEKKYNPETNKNQSEVVGTFTQYPLKLAWAITIHKSQGMTFDRMHFDLSRGTFAEGQAYVAISRMRTLDGLTLSRDIRPQDIIQNNEIKAYSNSFNDMDMINDELSLGKEIYHHTLRKDYNNAVKVCLHYAIKKIKAGDYRNAALLTKRMFDVMLDDECLMGMTNTIPLLKDCSVTCDFLNAVLCLYGGRLKEAVGYADLVLDRKICPEAIFIKAKALFRQKRLEEAAFFAKLIRETTLQGEKLIADRKQYLFEARLNQQLGRPNLDTCKHLCRLCPEYAPTYMMLREEATKNGLLIEREEDEVENKLADAFNDHTVTDADFQRMLEEADKKGAEFIAFSKRVRKLNFPKMID